MTDNGGLAVQHLQYLPYGERYVDQRISGYSERFTFTGKERDEETGYGYFGARYMDHELMTMWLSVDPMSDKYPSMSPYSYCAWNPVKLVDPDGKMIDDYFSENGKYLGSDNAQTKNVRIISETIWNSLSKDIDGKTNHYVGFVLSTSFSQKSQEGMSVESQLEVYNHYNPTDYLISAKKEEKSNTKVGGMATIVGFSNKKTTIRLEININGNINTVVCDNADEITSCFAHEQDHSNKAKEMGYHKYIEYQQNNRYDLELSAVNAQKRHSSWLGTSEQYKKRVDKYLNQYK
ncbi:MAG: RHS repeat-associated core domain-containing protein [Bacteroidales bacterium]|nr:RHS repeat-associated core domain-containing protein [Bacteroidales bacterium]